MGNLADMNYKFYYHEIEDIWYIFFAYRIQHLHQ